MDTRHYDIVRVLEARLGASPDELIDGDGFQEYYVVVDSYGQQLFKAFSFKLAVKFIESLTGIETDTLEEK